MCTLYSRPTGTIKILKCSNCRNNPIQDPRSQSSHEASQRDPSDPAERGARARDGDNRVREPKHENGVCTKRRLRWDGYSQQYTVWNHSTYHYAIKTRIRCTNDQFRDTPVQSVHSLSGNWWRGSKWKKRIVPSLCSPTALH